MSEHSQMLSLRYAAVVEMNLRGEADQLAHILGLTTHQVDAHFRAQGSDSGWEPDDFETFSSLPPGRFDARVLEQATWWVDVLRRPHRITDRDDFGDDHLLAVIDMLRREGWRWADGVDARWLTEPEQSSNDDPADRLLDGTPLMRTLLAEVARRGLAV